MKTVFSLRLFYTIISIGFVACDSGLAFADDGNGTAPSSFAVASMTSPTAPSTSLVSTPSSTSSTPTTSPLSGAELQVSANGNITPSSNVNGGTSYGLDTKIYSPTLDTNWRLFAGQYFAHEDEPDGEGSIGFTRSTAGVEYHNDTITTNLAPTLNLYKGTERVGAVGDATWNLNSQWSLGGDGQYFSRDIPLRALNAGITANSYDANVTWHNDDLYRLILNGNAMTFSDGNVRTGAGADYMQRLYTSDHLIIDGLANATESQNSENENRLYYNPNHDLLGLLGARVTQPLYRENNFIYQHSLEVTPGGYWQQNYGASPMVNAHYEQRINFNESLSTGLGVLFSRQSFDGVPENDVTLLFDLTKRF